MELNEIRVCVVKKRWGPEQSMVNSGKNNSISKTNLLKVVEKDVSM